MATEITIHEHPNPPGDHRLLVLNVEGNHTDVFVTPSAEFVEGWLIYTRDVTRNMYFEDRFVVAIGVTGSTEAQTIQLFVKDKLSCAHIVHHITIFKISASTSKLFCHVVVRIRMLANGR